jgi:hypothetical protein
VEAAGIGRGGYVQAPTGGVSTFGADRVAAYKVETHCPKPEGLASRVYTVWPLFLDV